MQPIQRKPAWVSQLSTPSVVFLAALAFYCVGIGWGLPAGNETWAADSIKPGAPLAVLHKQFLSGGWNSGWFWFKYPPGHVLVLAVAYAPYLLFQLASGAISHPTSAYPYGMTDPQATLTTLALIGRVVTACMAAGIVATVFLCLVRSYGRVTAACAAGVTAVCAPLVFYAHTTNVEVPYVFWSMLALLAAVRLTEGSVQARYWVLLGVSAAMAVSTKEISAGFVALLPVGVLWSWLRRRDAWTALVRGGALAGACAVVTMTVANNVLWNPGGFWNRVRFLTHSLPDAIAAKYAPYTFPVDLAGARGWAAELAQLALAGTRTYESLGPVAVAAAALGMVVVAMRTPGLLLLATASIGGFYLLGVKAMLSLSLRYVLPIAVLATMGAGIALGWMLSRTRAPWLWRAVAAAVMVMVALPGLDVTRMLLLDGRYQAERWLSHNAQHGSKIETYQPYTYLPRFPPSVIVDRVPFQQRTVEAFRTRRPDYVVLSRLAGSGLAGVTVSYKTDWRQGEDQADSQEWVPAKTSASGKVLSYHGADALRLLSSLEDGSLGYHVVARFHVRPMTPVLPIQSLNPEIIVYGRGQTG